MGGDEGGIEVKRVRVGGDGFVGRGGGGGGGQQGQQEEGEGAHLAV
jgi:hypothetical protein